MIFKGSLQHIYSCFRGAIQYGYFGLRLILKTRREFQNFRLLYWDNSANLKQTWSSPLLKTNRFLLNPFNMAEMARIF